MIVKFLVSCFTLSEIIILPQVFEKCHLFAPMFSLYIYAAPLPRKKLITQVLSYPSTNVHPASLSQPDLKITDTWEEREMVFFSRPLLEDEWLASSSLDHHRDGEGEEERPIRWAAAAATSRPHWGREVWDTILGQALQDPAPGTCNVFWGESSAIAQLWAESQTTTTRPGKPFVLSGCIWCISNVI